MSLFLKIFALIFLAELGDKTQLAVMASAANQPSARWTILLAASAAMALSTLVAVLFGAQITRWIPERVIKLAAAVLFLLFGALLLREALVSSEKAPPRTDAASEAVPAVGAVGRRILKEAIELERLAFEDYRALADRVQDEGLRRLLRTLAGEEETHRQLLLATDRSAPRTVAPASDLAELPSQADLAHHVAASDQPLLEHAIEHELGTAAFYRQLAKIAVVPNLRTACLSLAASEESHARRLREFAET